MALPTLEKTWQVSLNNRYYNSNADTVHRWALSKISTVLTGFASNPWTLVGSNDESTYGYPGPGWPTYASVVAGRDTGAGAWIVLGRPNSGGQLMLHVWHTSSDSSYDYNSIEVQWSPGGNFTGGDLSSHPTATDAISMISDSPNTHWFFDQASTGQPISLHFRHSTDGKHTYMFLCANGYASHLWIATTPEDAPGDWTTPHLMAMRYAAASNTEYATTATLYSEQYFRGRSNDASAISASMVLPLYDGSLVTSVLPYPNEYDTSPGWPMVPISVGAGAAGESKGILGRLPDIWVGSATRKTCDTYPADGTKTFAQFGDFVVPWDGSAPTAW